MLFKVIKTLNSGIYANAIIPDGWEKGGTLYWPRKYKLCVLSIDDILNPGDEWDELECVVTRDNIPSYDNALNAIVNKDCNSEYNEDVLLAIQKRKPPDLNVDKNDDADTALNPPKSSASIGNQGDLRSLVKDDENLAKASSIKCQALNDMITDSGPRELNPNPTPVSIGTDPCYVTNPASNSMYSTFNTPYDVSELNQRLENERIHRKLDDLTAKVSTIIENQNVMSANQGALSSMFEQFMKLHTTPVFSDRVPESSVDFKIVENEKELEELEERLKDPAYVQILKKKFSLISGRDDGNGVNVAYKLIDMMFSREFFTHCSWAGGSRQDRKKICFKMFQRIMDFFLSVIRESDHLFTLDDCEKFLKSVLKNSRSRSQCLNMRRSTKKHRPSRREMDNLESDDEERDTVERLIRDAITVDVGPPCVDYE